MIFFLTSTLLLSSLGIVSLLTLKRYETRTGHLVLAGVRPKVGGVLQTIVLFVEHILPALVRHTIASGWRALRDVLKRLLARGILLFELVLHRMLTYIHDVMQPPQGGGQASAFLREVAEHKRKLLQRSPEKRVILDE